MRILVTADWHLDHWRRSGRDPLAGMKPHFASLDALIIAGDLAAAPTVSWPYRLAELGQLIAPEKVYVFPGNHDYYSWDLSDEAAMRELVENAGMNWAQQAVLTFGDVRLLCCTLWTDFALNHTAETSMRIARAVVNDYRATWLGKRAVTPDDILAIHRDHLQWLTEAIAVPFEGRTIVVTHHGPSPSVAGPIDEITPAFVSNLDRWIVAHNPHAWLCGHTHRQLSGRVHMTRIVNTSLGYPGEVAEDRVADSLLRGLIDTDVEGMLPLLLPPDETFAVVREIAPDDKPSGPETADEAKARLRRQILAGVQMLSENDVARLLGTDPRQPPLSQELLSFLIDGETQYPRFQFDQARRRVEPAFAAVRQAARDADWSDVRLVNWLMRSHDGLETNPAALLARRPADVLQALIDAATPPQHG